MATQWISRDHVVAALDFRAVLAHYDIEVGKGSSFRIHCPFHEDDRPSCSVNAEDKVFNCFACGEQGNILEFIAAMEGFEAKSEFRAVLETAIEFIGHNPTPARTKRVSRNDRSPATAKGNRKQSTGHTPKDKGSDEPSSHAAKPKRPEKSQARKAKRARKSETDHDRSDGSHDLPPNVPLEAPAFPLKLEPSHPWLDEQLARIGVSKAVAAEFGIGFEGRSKALMAARVCFPIHNVDGELVAYSGRWASDDCDEQGRYFDHNGREQPRYRLPKTFSKQLELFNWHRVREHYSDSSAVVLVEGFWSVLRLQAHTVPAVALMGLSISEAQIRLLQEGGIRSVILMLDGDDEGRDATRTILPRLASRFLTRSIDLPDGTKPDDCDERFLQEVKTMTAEVGLLPMSAIPERSASDRDWQNAPNGKPRSETGGTHPTVTTSKGTDGKSVNQKSTAGSQPLQLTGVTASGKMVWDYASNTGSDHNLVDKPHQ